MGAVQPINRIPCSQKIQLAMEYKQAADACRDAVSELLVLVGIVVKEDYETLKRAADTAEQRLVAAREALERHTEEHGC